MEMQFRTAYGPKEKCQITFGKKTRTKQAMKEECDINMIMAKYQKTGAVTHVNEHGADYGFASGLSFQESMNLVIKAQNMFEELPSSIREKFANSPGRFLDFVQDPENADELVELGLAKKAIPEVGPKADVVVDGDLEAPEPGKPGGSEEKAQLST